MKKCILCSNCNGKDNYICINCIDWSNYEEYSDDYDVQYDSCNEDKDDSLPF